MAETTEILVVLDLEGPRSPFQQASVFGDSPLFLACGWLLCPHMAFPLSIQKERTSAHKLSSFLSYEDTNPIRSGSHPYDLV